MITRTYYCKKKVDIVELYARYLSLSYRFIEPKAFSRHIELFSMWLKKNKDGRESVNSIRSGTRKQFVIQNIAENQRFNREKIYTGKDIA